MWCPCCLQNTAKWANLATLESKPISCYNCGETWDSTHTQAITQEIKLFDWRLHLDRRDMEIETHHARVTFLELMSTEP